eukprot:980789-Karenia_brevis.AAC.1
MIGPVGLRDVVLSGGGGRGGGRGGRSGRTNCGPLVGLGDLVLVSACSNGTGENIIGRQSFAQCPISFGEAFGCRACGRGCGRKSGSGGTSE